MSTRGGDLRDRLAETARAGLREELQEGLVCKQAAVGRQSQEVVVDSPRFHVTPGPKYSTYITLRSQSGLDGAVELADGRWPARVTEPAALPGTPPIIEIAVSTPAR